MVMLSNQALDRGKQAPSGTAHIMYHGKKRVGVSRTSDNIIQNATRTNELLLGSMLRSNTA